MSGGGKGQTDPIPKSQFEELRDKIGKEFQQWAALQSAARRPLPDQTGDGTYLDLTPDTPDLIKKIEDGLKDLAHLGITDIGTLLEVQKKNKDGAPWNDKDYLMERLIQTAADFPDGSVLGKKVTDGFLTVLYNDLQHPPISYLGENYQYRSADGSNNSLVHPNLGKTGQPYARTVAPKGMQPGAYPDAGVIFDSIMARKPENRIPHPNKISSVLFYLASIIIHDLFRTDHQKFAISKTSSYLDLAPLYGSNLEEQMRMRTGLDGKLKPDCFSETRLLSFPPGVGALLIMFNRFHQTVVEQLATINEKNQFKRPTGDPPKIDYTVKEWWTKIDPAWKKYDEALFQTGRLVTSGLYINIILVDYVRTILNLNKTSYNWALNPRADIKGVPVASGNQVSAEFNLVYRWHSAISPKDEKWTEELLKKQFPDLLGNGDWKKLDWHCFAVKAKALEDDLQSKDPTQRPFAGLKRNEKTGLFDDGDLAKIVTESIEDCANSYGANRVPECMRVIEQLGIEQSRQWSLASLNEFRKYFNLTPHKTFESINSNPEVADQLRRLYDHPDQVELYPGLVAEEPKEPWVPGAGLTPSFTVSRAVLSDAVALVRGDRFYTVDYHPKKLTNWGYTAVASDTAINNGGVAYKLYLNAFPNHFRANSIYVHYPLTIPGEMETVMKGLDRHSQYDFTKPGKLPDTHVVLTYDAVKAIISNQEQYKVTWGGSMEYLISPEKRDFMAKSSGLKESEARKTIQQTLAKNEKWEATVREYFEKATAAILKEKAYKLANVNQVDIIRDIGNLVPVRYVAELFQLPLKSEKARDGIFTEHELYLALLAIYTSFLKDSEAIDSFQIRQISYGAVQTLGGLVEAHVDELDDTSIFSKLMSAIFENETPLQKAGKDITKTLLNAGLDVKHVVWGHVLSTAAGVTATTGSLFANVLEYFLTGPPQLLKFVNTLAKQDTKEAFKQLQQYVLEAARLSGQTAAYRSVDKATTLPDGEGRTLNLKAGDRVLLNLRSASRDPKKFPKPDEFVPDRSLDDYLHLGIGPHDNLGFATTRVALTAMLKVVLRLDNLKGAPGQQGKVQKIVRDLPGDAKGEKYNGYLTENWDQVWPVPQSLKINWS